MNENHFHAVGTNHESAGVPVRILDAYGNGLAVRQACPDYSIFPGEEMDLHLCLAIEALLLHYKFLIIG